MTGQADDAALTAGLFPVAVKTNDLAATVAFYTRIIGLQQVARPDFGYPGAWLGVKLPGGLLFR
jgi:catechol 2,3-dioxygenase-like lactoylglutathione lyase family enzyme